MTQIKGSLVPKNPASTPGKTFAGHSVEAMFPVTVKLPDGKPFSRPRYLQADAGADGRFIFELSDGEKITGASEFIVRSPAGSRLTIVQKEKLDNLQIPVDPFAPVDLGDVTLLPGPIVKFRSLRVILHDLTDPTRQANRLVLLWGKKHIGPNEVPDAGGPNEFLLSADQTDSSGRVRLEVPSMAFADLQVEVLGDSSGKGRTALVLTSDGLPPESVDIPVSLPPIESPETDTDCACDANTPPRAPDHVDLLSSDGVFSQDINGGSCVKLAVPNRTLEEYSFYSLVRTTDPVLWGQRPPKGTKQPISKAALALASELAFGASGLDASLTDPPDRGSRRDETPVRSTDELRVNSEAYRASGLISARGWREATDIESTRKVILEKASSLSEDTLRHALSDPDGFTPVTLMTAERRSAVDEVERLTSTLSLTPAGRQPISTENGVPWDGARKTTQAATIAHGHLLEFRQVWKADGYSLGDLAYSLPLAPGQKRRMVIADFDRQEVGIRQESRTFREDFRADLSRDRDVSEIVNSTVTESIRGGSSTNTWGAGGGIGLGIPIGAGFLGIGVAGGGGGSSSTAWQNSARGLAASAAQNLSDRTQQASSAVRSQRGTVVTSQRQSESVSVTSEIVANYNHCHAITIEYFVVLKHYRVDQALESVDECLFVPLLMTPFDDFKTLRWQDILIDRLRKRQLRSAFAAIHRIQTGYADADVPTGRYADEVVKEVWGELKFELNFARPRLPAEDEPINDYLNSSWNFWDQIFGPTSAEQAYKTNIAGQSLSDKIFATELAPRLARAFCDSLQMSVTLNDGTVKSVPVDVTMVSNYYAGREHLVTFRSTSFPAAIRRSDIRGITISTSLDFAPNSLTILRYANVSYRNVFRSFKMVPARRDADDVRIGDSAFLSTRTLSRDEEFNPREKDLQLRSDLLKHLNEHIEHYHQLIWWLMDAGRRFMLLDGFVAPNSAGRSVASVTENRIINIIGNSIVLPVAPGYLLDPTVFRTDDAGNELPLLEVYQPTIPVPPRRITVTTRGVYAEAIMGSCNSCEKTEEDRFWRWEEEPTGDEPTEIGTTSTESRREAPASTTLTDFPAPVVAIQNAPPAPDPTAMSAFTALLGQQSLFKDVSGLAQNQTNALGAFKQAMQTANNFGKLAAAGAKAIHAQKNSERVMKKVNDARAKKILTDDDAKQVTKKLFGVLNSDLGGGKKALGEETPVKEAVDKLLKGGGKKTLSTSSTSGNTSQEAKVEISDGAVTVKPVVESLVDGIVPMIPQVLSKGCWAASIAMIKSWAKQHSMSIEAALAEGGQSYLDKYTNNTGLQPNEVATFMQDFSLRDASIGALTADGLAKQIKERGPLWVIADQDASVSFSAHARVITGIVGDGTTKGTKVIFNDPAKDQPSEETLMQLITELEELAEGISSAFGGFAPQILSI